MSHAIGQDLEDALALRCNPEATPSEPFG